jgi:P-type Cu2+ transporter
MKTSVIEVRDMLSVLSVQGVEERIGDVPGVESVTVNFAAGSATVRYDETRLDIADIKSDVRQRGYDEEAAPAASGKSVSRGHHDHPMPAASVSPPATAASKSSAGPPPEPAEVGADALGTTAAKAPDKPAQPAAAPSVPEAAAADHAASAGGEEMPMPEKG